MKGNIMVQFEKATIKKYFPKTVKNDEGEEINKIVIQVHADLDNGMNVQECYNYAFKGLCNIIFTDRVTTEPYSVNNTGFAKNPFGVKERNVKGEDGVKEKVEYLDITFEKKINSIEEAVIFSDLYSMFNIDVNLEIKDA